MNILMVSDGYFPERVGGSYRYLSGLSRELVRRGHQVHVLVPKIEKALSDIETIDGIVIHRFEYIRILPFVSLLSQVINSRRMFKKILREVKPSIISFHHALPSFGIVTIRAIKRTPKVFTFHGPWGEEYRARVKTSLLSGIYTKMMSFLEKFVINRCRSILVLSEFSKGLLKEIHGVSPEKVSVIPGGLDIGFFSPSDKTAARERLKIPEDSKILFTIRRLDPRMGLDVLLRAFKIVTAKVKGVRLLIGGTGPAMSSLLKLRDELGLTDSVDFLGHVSEEDLPYYYRAADISVLPSRVLEGFGLMTIESLSCGTPVVGTPVGSTIEILGKYEKRLLFKDNSADSMAEKIIDIFSGGGKDILYMGEKCRSFVEENFNWSEITRLVEEFYLLAGRKKNIDAAYRVNKIMPDVKFLIVGDEMFNIEAGYKKELLSMTRDLGLEDSIIFTSFHENVQDYIDAMDILVHASINPEPFGLVICEGMALRKTVIATDAGGPCEIINDPEIGYLVPPGNSLKLAEVIINYLNSPEEMKAIGLKAEKRIREYFSVERMIERIESLYGEIVYKSGTN